MMNSSCSPNTQNSIDNRWVCRVRAARAIRKGEEICDTYTATLCNTLYRRRSLKQAKYFDCACARCSDPTELGSHFSSLVCRLPGCPGLVLSTVIILFPIVKFHFLFYPGPPGQGGQLEVR